MKNRKDTSRQNSDQAPVTFCDVAACFSEEEWKLLHHWQKELYTNVMKEIHQALISLGPLIATSVFSLKPKLKEDPSPLEFQDLGIRDGEIVTEPDVLLRKSRNAKEYQKATQYPDQSESHDGSSTGYQIFNSDSLLKIEHEMDLNLMEHYGEDEGESSAHPCFDFPYQNVQEEACYKDTRDTEIEQSSTNLNPGPAVKTQNTSIGINEEGEIYPLDVQRYEERKNMYHPAGEGNSKRKNTDEDSIEYFHKSIPNKTSSERNRVKLIRTFKKPTNSRSQLLEKSYICQPGNDVKTSDFNENAHFNLHLGTLKVEGPEQDHEGESTLWEAQVSTGHPNMQISLGTYTVPGCGKPFTPNLGFTEQERIQTEIPHENHYYQCKKCDKSFSQKGQLISHERTHSSQKPYHCTQCEKSFTQKHRLIGHQKTHLEERPFQCAKCKKRFSWKESLHRHYKTHTGERPHQCAKCKKSFSRREGLLRHQRTHMAENFQLNPSSSSF